MTHRAEFSRKTKLAAWERCGGHCEGCGVDLTIPGQVAHYDHIIPCFNGGDNSLENCQVLCEKACHKPKSATEAPAFAKSRREDLRRAGIEPRKKKLPGSKGSGWKHKIGGRWERR